VFGTHTAPTHAPFKQACDDGHVRTVVSLEPAASQIFTVRPSQRLLPAAQTLLPPPPLVPLLPLLPLLPLPLLPPLLTGPPGVSVAPLQAASNKPKPATARMLRAMLFPMTLLPSSDTRTPKLAPYLRGIEKSCQKRASDRQTGKFQ
jgi:hypothetical protein